MGPNNNKHKHLSKAQDKLMRRRMAFDNMSEAARQGFTRPGSMNRRKQA